MPLFDASITIGSHHLADAGIDPGTPPASAIDAVRAAVARIPGAAWVDVEVEDAQPSARMRIDIYPPGFARSPNTPQWRQLRDTVEATTRTALAAVSGPIACG
jgi:hypothetical protein